MSQIQIDEIGLLLYEKIIFVNFADKKTKTISVIYDNGKLEIPTKINVNYSN